jgi:hypothetical protein
MLAHAPAHAIFGRIRPVLNDHPAEISQFCRVALTRLLTGDTSRRATVAAITRELRVPRRALERAFHRARFMTPKELFDWMVMIATADVAVRRGESRRFYRLATSLGLEAPRVRSARLRLAPQLGPQINWPHEQFLENVLAAFRLRCRELAHATRPIRAAFARKAPRSTVSPA